MIRAMLICGSARRGSYTRALLKAFEENVREKGASTVLWDLGDEPLPIADPEYHRAPETHPEPAVRRLVGEVARADALALASPLYHGSYSGVLKNAIDHLGYDALRNKPVALLSHGGGVRTRSQPCDHLRSVVRTVYGYSTQTQVCSTVSDFRTDGERVVVADSEILARLERLAAELTHLARLLRSQNVPKED